MKIKNHNHTLSQLKTFRIFNALTCLDLLHLVEKSGLETKHYNTHKKRAIVMTLKVHEGLTEDFLLETKY